MIKMALFKDFWVDKNASSPIRLTFANLFRWRPREHREIPKCKFEESVWRTFLCFGNCRSCQLLRKHKPLILSTVYLTSKLACAISFLRTKLHIEVSVLSRLARRHYLDVVWPTKLCHRRWHFFVLAVEFVELPHVDEFLVHLIVRALTRRLNDFYDFEKWLSGNI